MGSRARGGSAHADGGCGCQREGFVAEGEFADDGAAVSATGSPAARPASSPASARAPSAHGGAAHCCRRRQRSPGRYLYHRSDLATIAIAPHNQRGIHRAAITPGPRSRSRSQDDQQKSPGGFRLRCDCGDLHGWWCESVWRAACRPDLPGLQPLRRLSTIRASWEESFRDTAVGADDSMPGTSGGAVGSTCPTQRGATGLMSP